MSEQHAFLFSDGNSQSLVRRGESWDFHKSKVEGNTGFYFVRSNPNTIKLWAHAFEAAPK